MYHFETSMKNAAKKKKAIKPKKGLKTDADKARQEKEREQVMKQLEALGYIG
jgi:hypothetical protein